MTHKVRATAKAWGSLFSPGLIYENISLFYLIGFFVMLGLAFLLWPMCSLGLACNIAGDERETTTLNADLQLGNGKIVPREGDGRTRYKQVEFYGPGGNLLKAIIEESGPGIRRIIRIPDNRKGAAIFELKKRADGSHRYNLRYYNAIGEELWSTPYCCCSSISYQEMRFIDEGRMMLLADAGRSTGCFCVGELIDMTDDSNNCMGIRIMTAEGAVILSEPYGNSFRVSGKKGKFVAYRIKRPNELEDEWRLFNSEDRRIYILPAISKLKKDCDVAHLSEDGNIYYWGINEKRLVYEYSIDDGLREMKE